MSVLVVGQSPTRSMSPDDDPFQGTRTALSIARLCGHDDPEWIFTAFGLVNIIDSYPGPDPEDPARDDFPRIPALLGAGITRSLIMTGEWDYVIALGPVVPLLLWGRRRPWFEWNPVSRPCDLMSGPDVLQVAASPFPPVGPDPWWDNPGNRNQGTQFWKAVAEHGRGERGVHPHGGEGSGAVGTAGDGQGP